MKDFIEADCREDRRLKHIFKIKIEPEMTDEYGHLNNARYLELFELARWHILEKSSLGIDYVREKKIVPVILEVNIKYKKEVYPGENIQIETCGDHDGGRIFYFFQLMKDKADNICATATFKAGLFDLRNRTMLKADEKWLKALTGENE